MNCSARIGAVVQVVTDIRSEPDPLVKVNAFRRPPVGFSLSFGVGMSRGIE